MIAAMRLHTTPACRFSTGSRKRLFLPCTSVPKFPSGRRPSRPSIPRQVAAAANTDKIAEILQSDSFNEALKPLRAECESAQDGAGLKVIVVSKAFEGKTAKRREKLVLQALQADEPEGVTIMAMTPSESAAMLKKWC